jgi:hypothetical protein
MTPYCQLPHAVCGHLTRLQWRDKLAADYERNHPRPSWRINGERQPYIPEHALGEPLPVALPRRLRRHA